MTDLLRNRHFRFFVAIYGVAVLVLILGGRPLEDVIGAFVILGIFLPLVALGATVRLPSPTAPTPSRADDRYLIAGLLAWVAAFLLLKGPLLASLVNDSSDPRLRDTVNTLLKLAAFVLLPWLVLRLRGYHWRQGGQPTAPRRRLWLAFVALALAGLAVQALLGSQFKLLLAGHYSNEQLAAGGVLCFVWMSIEAGIVEEFFFRWFLQSRLAAWTRSEVSAVFLGALLFGLAHAPGIVLRGGGAVEGLGDSPGITTTLAYVIATQGVAGLTFGVLWSRTRSFVLVVALHGFIDALSNTASFIDTWMR